MKHNTTKRLSFFALATFLLILGLIKFGQQHLRADTQPKEQALTVSAVVAQEGAVSHSMVFSGPVVGRDEVPIYSDLEQGRIDKIMVDAGQHVKAGAVLATVDSAHLRIQRAQQQANKERAAAAIKQQETALEEAQAQYEQAKAEHKRGEAVAQTGLISREVLEQRAAAELAAKTRVQAAKNALGMAQADFNLSSAQVAESDLRLNQAAIRSPVSGLIVERKARTGMSLAQNSEPLFNVLRDDDLEVELEVSADDAARLKLGMPATVQFVGDKSSAPAPQAANVAGNVDAALNRVESWAQAWQRKQVEAYLASYAEEFVPEQKLSKAAWVDQRKKRLSAKGDLTITLSQMNVQVNGHKATAEFVQHYTANGKKEDVNKRLTLANVNGDWLIVREQVVAKLDALQAERVPATSSPEPESAKVYNAKVSRAATQINRQNQIAKVRVRFDQTPNLILGQFARVTINTPSLKGIYLPDTAVRFEGAAAYVFTANKGIAKRVPVKVGQHVANKLEILEGVPVGMLVIDSAASFLRDGEPVRVSTAAHQAGIN